MHWHKIKTHLKHYANELDENGYGKEANYVRENLIPKIDVDLEIRNEQGKNKLGKLLGLAHE